MARNIGLNVSVPEKECDDVNCPFHGILPVRGQVITGKVVSDKMQGSVVVARDYLHYVKKYRRYEKRSSKLHAHNPPCIGAKVGDSVKIAECRPLSKTKKFVVVEVFEE
jgi:small subunit ribosomal protein S17